MSDFASISPAELAARRRKLRHQRRWRVIQTLWRTVAVSGLAGGLIWGVTLPHWMIWKASQIEIEGHQLLSEPTIHTLLPITYPQSLITLRPQDIADALESQPPIASATVARRLFPPSLMIQIQEHQPVAIAYRISHAASTAPSQPPASVSASAGSSSHSSAFEAGFLDIAGTWIPLESYNTNFQAADLPALKVVGLPDQYRSVWTKLYQQISQSPIKVLEVNWQDATNLILTTELGIIHCGSYSSSFPEQLRALARLRELPQAVDSSQIAYIDLRNPAAPLVQMHQTATASSREDVIEDTP